MQYIIVYRHKGSRANFYKARCNRLAKHKGASTAQKDENQNTEGKHHEKVRSEQHHEADLFPSEVERIIFIQMK